MCIRLSWRATADDVARPPPPARGLHGRSEQRAFLHSPAVAVGIAEEHERVVVLRALAVDPSRLAHVAHRGALHAALDELRMGRLDVPDADLDPLQGAWRRLG